MWLSSDSGIEEVSVNEAPAASKPNWQLLFFLFYWQSVFKVSNAAITCLLPFCKYFFSVVGKAFQSPQIYPGRYHSHSKMRMLVLVL